MRERQPVVAIVDYGMGNLFSVQRVSEYVGLTATITTSPQTVREADAVILPGVGAFGDAIAALTRLGLAEALCEFAASGKPLMGVCLGMQLLMENSEEFGTHSGLGLIAGQVIRFQSPRGQGGALKVPQIGWNRLVRPSSVSWMGSTLDGVQEGAYMYFVHSFYVRPTDPSVVFSLTRYGSIEFCSSLQRHNLFACQFHPERSGSQGVRIYRNFAAQVQRSRVEMSHG